MQPACFRIRFPRHENSKSLFNFTCMSVSVCVPHCVPGALRGQTSALDWFPGTGGKHGCRLSSEYQVLNLVLCKSGKCFIYQALSPAPVFNFQCTVLGKA